MILLYLIQAALGIHSPILLSAVAEHSLLGRTGVKNEFITEYNKIWMKFLTSETILKTHCFEAHIRDEKIVNRLHLLQ